MLINTGAYLFKLNTKQTQIVSAINILYGDVPCNSESIDFQISVRSTSFLRRFIRPQVSFYCDQHTPFKPLPASQAYPLFEWGMNWCIATHDHTRLLIHAAVLVKNGQAIIFPAAPGSGKSTLTAYHALSGWSLYSDEMAVIDLETGLVEPLYRPVCLKNDSIDLVKAWFPSSIFSPTWRDTQKGDVAHLKAKSWSEHQKLQPVPIIAIVFPKYVKDNDLDIYQLTQLQGFESLSKNAFNYSILGKDGFYAVDKLIRKAKLFEIKYNNLHEVDAFLTENVLL